MGILKLLIFRIGLDTDEANPLNLAFKNALISNLILFSRQYKIKK